MLLVARTLFDKCRYVLYTYSNNPVPTPPSPFPITPLDGTGFLPFMLTQYLVLLQPQLSTPCAKPLWISGD